MGLLPLFRGVAHLCVLCKGGIPRPQPGGIARSGTLAQYIKQNISGDVDVMVTDDFVTYPAAMKKAAMPVHKHRVVNHSAGQYVVEDFHTNSVESAFSLLKRGIIGTWHRVSAKHLPAYLDEMTWRFNNRKNPYLFRDTLLKLVV